MTEAERAQMREVAQWCVGAYGEGAICPMRAGNVVALLDEVATCRAEAATYRAEAERAHKALERAEAEREAFREAFNAELAVEIADDRGTDEDVSALHIRSAVAVEALRSIGWKPEGEP